MQRRIVVSAQSNSKKRIYIICKQIREGNTISKCDQRRKYFNRKNISPEEMIKNVQDHIEAIPKYSSHCSRKGNPNRVYIDHDLSVASLYQKHYKPWCTEHGTAPVKEDTYQQIFCNQYNIGFMIPKSDTCDQNKILMESNKDNESKLKEIKIQSDIYQRRAEAIQANIKQEIDEATRLNKKLVVCSSAGTFNF
ncbi:unnamed protein product [Psylliodes chrysocephalus]|uniref:Uncharacterized protein n=1 Tax=Psylliodes chrysocephalus TaxID=3402493 RepID=A0A9P0DG17_9CUCU|nr:unnamed protein product [Psylliodes chrysocephala]